MIIVRMRVQETCVLIVTKPEANAAKAQNGALSVVALDASTSTLTEVACVRRCKTIAITPTTILIVAATAIVVLRPMTGNNTKPAARVPRIAPARLHA